MNANELTQKLREINKEIKLDKTRVSEGRLLIKMLLDRIHEHELEARQIKANLKRIEEDRQTESKCKIDLSGIWGKLNGLGIDKKEIYVLQNCDLTYKEIAEVLGVSIERVRQIQAKALRKCKHNSILKAINPEVDDIEYCRNESNFFDLIQEQNAEREVFRCA